MYSIKSQIKLVKSSNIDVKAKIMIIESIKTAVVYKKQMTNRAVVVMSMEQVETYLEYAEMKNINPLGLEVEEVNLISLLKKKKSYVKRK